MTWKALIRDSEDPQVETITGIEDLEGWIMEYLSKLDWSMPASKLRVSRERILIIGERSQEHSVTFEEETKMTTVWQVTIESEDMAYDAGVSNSVFSTRELAEQWVVDHLESIEYTVHKGVQQGVLKQEYTNYVIDDRNEFYVIGTIVDQEE